MQCGVYVVVEVEDSGCGMTKEDMSNLFNAFQQANVSTTRHYGGTGLGLSISQSLVRMMEGELRASSDGIGKGSTFNFQIKLGIPLSSSDTILDITKDTDAAEVDTTETLELLKSSSGRPLNVAVFDDNEHSRRWICKSVKSFGGIIVPPKRSAEQSDGFSEIEHMTDFVIGQLINNSGDDGSANIDILIIDVGNIGDSTLTDTLNEKLLQSKCSKGWRGIGEIRSKKDENQATRIPILALSDSFRAPHEPPVDVDDSKQRICVRLKPTRSEAIRGAIVSLVYRINEHQTLFSGSSSDIAAIFSGDDNTVKPSNGQTQSSDSLHVLAVDDNSINLKLLSKMLQQLGHTYITKCDGQSALEILIETNFSPCSSLKPFDIVLSDVMMPGMDRYQLSRRITEAVKSSTSQKALPVIAVTAAANSEETQCCFDAGMVDVLTKPFTKQELKEHLEKVWHGQRQCDK